MACIRYVLMELPKLVKGAAVLFSYDESFLSIYRL